MERDNFAARFRKAYQTAFNAVLNRYKYGVPFFIRRKWLTWGRTGSRSGSARCRATTGAIYIRLRAGCHQPLSRFGRRCITVAAILLLTKQRNKKLSATKSKKCEFRANPIYRRMQGGLKTSANSKNLPFYRCNLKIIHIFAHRISYA